MSTLLLVLQKSPGWQAVRPGPAAAMSLGPTARPGQAAATQLEPVATQLKPVATHPGRPAQPGPPARPSQEASYAFAMWTSSVSSLVIKLKESDPTSQAIKSRKTRIMHGWNGTAREQKKRRLSTWVWQQEPRTEPWVLQHVYMMNMHTDSIQLVTIWNNYCSKMLLQRPQMSGVTAWKNTSRQTTRPISLGLKASNEKGSLNSGQWCWRRVPHAAWVQWLDIISVVTKKSSMSFVRTISLIGHLLLIHTIYRKSGALATR